MLCDKDMKELALTKVCHRKDDYAFFLAPVDATAVPGYSDVIKQPMDFGTMTHKVSRGRYRLLEDFAVCFFYASFVTISNPSTPYDFMCSLEYDHALNQLPL